MNISELFLTDFEDVRGGQGRKGDGFTVLGGNFFKSSSENSEARLAFDLLP